MMFKDQSQKLAGQNKASSATSPHKTSAKLRESTSIIFERCIDLHAKLSSNPSWEDQAIAFVFHNYASDNYEPCFSPGFFDYLPHIYKKSPPGSVLAEAVVALGLVGIANLNRDSLLLSEATLKYGTTARAISATLGDIEFAKQDEILISVLLLGLFEVISSSEMTISTLNSPDKCI